MNRRYRLTTKEFIGALQRAANDDRRWPWLGTLKWLVAHSSSKDGEVIIDTKGDVAPRPSASDLKR